MEARRVLVLGGARSGKSAYAQRLAEAGTAERVYLATGSAIDEEMAARIARHRLERCGGWFTREEPLELAAALRSEARPGRIVLVDCLTLWLSNCMLAGRQPADETGQLCAVLEELEGPVVLVSNELGSGLVPEGKLGRDFRDAHGRLNQNIGYVCDAVVLITAGLPSLLKPTPALSITLV